jgi:23S rRNA (cytosine1962-C5)-methyltransferase
MASFPTAGRCVLAKQAKSLHHSFHPWIFSGSIAHEPANHSPGTPLAVTDGQGSFVGWAQYNPGSKIRLRILSWREDRYPDRNFYADQLSQALCRRQPLQDEYTTAVRLIFSEADGLPGLIVDRLANTLVVQFLTFGMDAIKSLITELLIDLAPQLLPSPFELRAIVERSDGDGRQLEGLPPVQAILYGVAEPISIVEAGVPFLVNSAGQKTGFYTDQRANRARVASYARGARMLDVCAYTGGFSVHAQRAGAASCTLIDSSAQALNEAQVNLSGNARLVEADAFQELRRLYQDSQRYDLIVLDPPKLAPTRASLPKALAAYKDLNLQALKLLEPGGVLASFSCSGLVKADDLRLWIAYAAKDAGKRVQILEQLHQAPCHPILLSFPESEYLKGFILRVVE